MAAGQLARGGVGETVADFMERRRREVERRDQAEGVGRDAWAASTTTGRSWSAPRTADVVALGARLLGGQTTSDGAAVPAARPTPRQASAPIASRPAAGPRKAFALSTQPSQAAGSSYGSLYAPPPDDLAELRRQQAEFARITREIDKQNSWFAIPALAPVAAVAGLETAAAIAGRTLASEAVSGPLNFLDREAWQRGAQRAAQALTRDAKTALREQARIKYARANGIAARDMQAEVHHSEPLEWAHLKPEADPNRLANLWGLRKEAHAIASREWAEFSRALNGRMPTQAELMQVKLRIDRMVEPYIRRAGVPRSDKPPGKGGPR